MRAVKAFSSSKLAGRVSSSHGMTDEEFYNHQPGRREGGEISHDQAPGRASLGFPVSCLGGFLSVGQ